MMSKNVFLPILVISMLTLVLFSCDIGLKKPDPKIYQKIADALDINPSQILMVGDNIRADVNGPKSTGMNAIHLNRKKTSSGSIFTLEEIFQYL